MTPSQNSMWSQPPYMANQIYPDQSMNLYRNQINQNPGWPGPGPYQNQVLPNQPGHNQTGNSNGMGPPPLYATDPDKRKMIQNQLIILIHAAKCQKRAENQDRQVSFYYIFNGGYFKFHFQQQQCQIPHCQTMKNVLMHLPNCQMGRNCTIQVFFTFSMKYSILNGLFSTVLHLDKLLPIGSSVSDLIVPSVSH